MNLLTRPADSASPPTGASAFRFRPWVAKSCLKAMVWGVGVVALLGLVAWWLRTPGAAPLSRAFGSLVFYGSLFWLTLLKIWWTASRSPAVRLGPQGIAYQPLHTFRPKRLAWSSIVAFAPRKKTASVRFVFLKRSGTAREFFLNLAVVERGGEFLDALEVRLRAAGLERDPRVKRGWIRAGYDVPIES